MNADVKQKWVAALRSGEYKQGSGGLRFNDTYCCLGVLCDLQDPGGWTATKANGGVGIVYSHDKIEFLVTYPSEEVKSWSGIGSIETLSELAKMNDGGDTFAQIANWIEANL